MTKWVSGMRHYTGVGVLSFQTSLGTPRKLNLIMKFFFDVKVKITQLN